MYSSYYCKGQNTGYWIHSLEWRSLASAYESLLRVCSLIIPGTLLNIYNRSMLYISIKYYNIQAKINTFPIIYPKANKLIQLTSYENMFMILPGKKIS